MLSFKNKTIIITGASAGVGAATARKLAQQKANLVLVARGEKALTAITEELSQHCQVISVAMDVADSKACKALLEKAFNNFGSIHVLINNAGCHHRGPVEDNEGEQLALMVDINLRAPIELTALILPYIRKSGNGAIVNVGSLAGRTPLQGSSTYAATKAGLRAFTHSLADEVRGSGIHVGIVSPGPIDTGFIMDEMDKVEDIVFSQAMSSADQVADAILHVASGKATEICLPASGGWLTNLSYLLPKLRRRLRPALYRKGRKAKEKYRKNNAAS